MNEAILELETVSFIRENHPKWKDSSAAKIAEYLTWFADRGLLAIVASEEEIYGVCAIKLFDKLTDFLEPWPFDPTGKFCLVDLLVAVSPLAIADCFKVFFDRWGPQEIMLWDRGERTEGGAPRMYTWNQYLKLTRRLTYGVIDYGKFEDA